ncbi:MAG: shikimate kinase [Lachnospiraceae bacterium]|nr:shikimate kinase [Lachnospiraceae bacterium]
MKNNIVLIGMPGAGKSTVGVVLAKVVGYKFVDSDLVIQEQTGKLLHELITEHGLNGFLEIENQTNASLNLNKAVVATGGSVIYGAEAMNNLREIGLVVYLKLSLESIAERLGDLQQRGVALKEGFGLKELYEERVPLYEKYADVVIDCEEKLIREITEEIAGVYEKHLESLALNTQKLGANE